MEHSRPIRCRVAACREALDDGKEWSFYLINDGAAALDSVVLQRIGYEWGDIGNSEEADVHVTGVAPGGHVLMWRDDGSGAELRMELSFRVRVREREVQLQFEFPKLYRQRNLPLVAGLGKPGFAVNCEQ
jgi:hypothetical protein